MIPKYEELMLPVLQILSDKQERDFCKIIQEIKQSFKLTDEDMNTLSTSGVPVIKTNINWAIVYLYKAGLLLRPKRGTYSISDEGINLLKQNITSLNCKYLEEYSPSLYAFTHTRKVKLIETSEIIEETEKISNEEIIKENLNQLIENLVDQLLIEVRNISPQRFEQLVVDLMLKMGYGGEDETAGYVTSYSGDEGIDGIIKEDVLGLDTIYIQAKRYAENHKVDRPTLQAFVGALDGKHSKRGVFITTSSFTNQAIDYAKNTSARIILIDGRQLCRYMIKFNLGVIVKEQLLLKQIDQNYFIKS